MCGLQRCFLQDVQGSLDANRPCPPSKKRLPSDTAASQPAASQPAAAAADVEQKAASAPAAFVGPKLTAPPPAAATSPCMVKTDLREFIAAQRIAVSGTLALNPAQTPLGERKAYKWPTKTLGSQVGGSLTKLTAQESGSSGGGQRACGSAYRIGKKSS